MVDFKKFPQLKRILKQQCEFAALKFEEIDFDQPEWFSKYEWTVEDEEEFKSWLLTEARENSALRNEIFPSAVNNMKMLKRAIEMFVLAYGFKCVEKEDDYGKT